MHRRLVRQTIANTLPPSANRLIDRIRCYSGVQPAHRVLIEKWAVADQRAPRKQRHTGERVYQHLRAPHSYTGSVVTARLYFYHFGKIKENKGTTGKTNIDLQFICDYAETCKDKRILAIDLSPQANLSDLCHSDVIKKYNTIQCYNDPVPFLFLYL